MKIKKATPDDLESVAYLFDLYRQFYKQPSDLNSAKNFLSERINKDESVIYLALDENSNRSMGFVQLFPLFTSVGLKRLWLLNDLYVHEDFRKMGVGEALMEKSRELAVETNAKGIFLQTHNSNIQAQSLYEKLDYKRDLEFYSYYLQTVKVTD